MFTSMIWCVFAVLLPQATSLYYNKPIQKGVDLLSTRSAVAIIQAFNAEDGHGFVAFRAPQFAWSATTVEIALFNLKAGDYILQIHYFGDTTDDCQKATGGRWHLVRAFTMENDGAFSDRFKDRLVSVNDLETGVIGRAVSLVRRGENGDFNDLLACNVIGIGEEDERLRAYEPVIRIYNPVPFNFVHGSGYGKK